MGWVDRLRNIRLLPSLSPSPQFEIYRATVKIEDHPPHQFTYAVSKEWDRPFILENRSAFTMPDTPIFVKQQKNAVKMPDGHLYPLYEITPVESRDVVPDDTKIVSVPSDFHGEQIPRVKDRTGELRELFE